MQIISMLGVCVINTTKQAGGTVAAAGEKKGVRVWGSQGGFGGEYDLDSGLGVREGICQVHARKKRGFPDRT